MNNVWQVYFHFFHTIVKYGNSLLYKIYVTNPVTSTSTSIIEEIEKIFAMAGFIDYTARTNPDDKIQFHTSDIMILYAESDVSSFLRLPIPRRSRLKDIFYPSNKQSCN